MRNDSLHTGAPVPDRDLETLFGELFKKYQQPLHKLALKVIKSNQQSRDVVQNVFFKLWERRSQIRDIENIEAWLYRVTKNELIDFLRKAAADSRLRARLWREMQLSIKSTEQQIDARECNSRIYKAVNQLPPQRRLVYTLNRDKGMSYQEIAEELSISRHTVKNQLSLALRFIHRFLSGSVGIFLLLLTTR